MTLKNVKKYDKFNEVVYEYQLDNGLSLTVIPKSGFTKTFVCFGTKYGAMVNNFIPYGKTEYQQVPLGIAHFLEHKLFASEEGDATLDFTKLGLEVNAYTSYTETVYLFKGTKYINEGINLLLDFVQNPHFTDENVEGERGIIIQELRMYLDNPSDCLSNGLLNNMFVEYPLKYDIGGTVSEVKKITKEMLYTCYDTFYHPSNMNLVVVGNADPDAICAVVTANQAKKQFKPALDIKMKIPVEDNIVKRRTGKKKMEIVMPKVAVGLKLPYEKRLTNEAIVLEVLFKIVLEIYFGSSTDFYQKLLDDEVISGGLNYSVYIDQYAGFIRLSTNTEKVKEFKKRIQNRIIEISKGEMKIADFNVLKKAMIGNFIRSLNSLDYIATTIFEYKVRDCDMYKVIELLDQLTLEDAKKMSKYFVVDALTDFTIMPL